jgi:hypothetical protein
VVPRKTGTWKATRPEGACTTPVAHPIPMPNSSRASYSRPLPRPTTSSSSPPACPYPTAPSGKTHDKSPVPPLRPGQRIPLASSTAPGAPNSPIEPHQTWVNRYPTTRPPCSARTWCGMGCYGRKAVLQPVQRPRTHWKPSPSHAEAWPSHHRPTPLLSAASGPPKDNEAAAERA